MAVVALEGAECGQAARLFHPPGECRGPAARLAAEARRAARHRIQSGSQAEHADPHRIAARTRIVADRGEGPAQRIRREGRKRQVEHAAAGIALRQFGPDLRPRQVRGQRLHADEADASQHRRHQGRGAAAPCGQHDGARDTGQQDQGPPLQEAHPGEGAEGRRQQKQGRPASAARRHHRHRRSEGGPERRFDDEDQVAVQPARIEGMERVDAIHVECVESHVQPNAQEAGRGQPAPRRAAFAHQAPDARPEQPHQAEQQRHLGQAPQQGMRVAAVMHQVAQRRRQERGEHQVQVGKIAGDQTGGEQGAAPGAAAHGIGFGRQRTLDQFAERQADQGMGEVIHPESLH